jgi:hypothetical protein
MTLCCATRTRLRCFSTGAAASVWYRASRPTMAIPFVRQLLGYLPDQTQRSFRAPLRRVDFYDGFAVYRDSRRKAEIYMDPTLLPFGWDPTWNQWKHLVGTKIGVSAAFVNSGKYRVRDNECRLVEWQTALPSRLSIYGAGSRPRTDP